MRVPGSRRKYAGTGHSEIVPKGATLPGAKGGCGSKYHEPESECRYAINAESQHHVVDQAVDAAMDDTEADEGPGCRHIDRIHLAGSYNFV